MTKANGKSWNKLLSRVPRFGRWLIGLGVVFTLLYFLPTLPFEFRDLKADSSLILTDRNGLPLRRQLSARQGVNHWIALEDCPEILRQAVLHSEDKRFYVHPGFDPLAILRASKDNFEAGGVVSGASTITQQLIRTLRTPKDRSLFSKFTELYWASRLEWIRSKDEILEAYLNRVAFGPSVYGVEEASRYYFDKPAGALSAAEAAVLAVTIRSPGVLDPFTANGKEELEKWTLPLLDRLEKAGAISSDSAERARNQELELSAKAPPFLAPHFCDLALSGLTESRGQVRTTLDYELQESVEGMVSNHLALLRGHEVGNAAVVVAEVESGEILAMVGSASFTRRRDGQHNAANSLRQPGSTLKPFTYGLLMQRAGHAGFILPDLPLYEDADSESFVPLNYDRHFHGPVSIRTALACSYNVPAVRALERVGPENLLQLLRRSGLKDLTEDPDHYGLGLTLGDGSASLLQLVSAYRSLAQGGQSGELSLIKEKTSGQVDGILDPRVCYLLSQVLDDDESRIASFGTPNALEFPFPVAVKTGTSKGYRDNWAIGFTPTHVVGVWVGNSDGRPMRDVSGITGAGPLFRDIVLTLGDGGEFSRPDGLTERELCLWSGQRAQDWCPSTRTELCLKEKRLKSCQVCVKTQGKVSYNFPSLYDEWAKTRGLAKAIDTALTKPLDRQSPEGQRAENEPLRFVYPLAEDIFMTSPDLHKARQKVKFRIAGGVPPFEWQLDGQTISKTKDRGLWWQLDSGSHTITVLDAVRQTRTVSVRVVDPE